MEDEKKDFDKEAVHWDEDPGKVKLANGIAEAISNEIDLTSDMNVLDFGCGTGLVTLLIQPMVHMITGIDSSQKMLDVLNTKIEKLGVRNVKLQRLDLEKGDVLTEKYHLIISSMSLHHIREIRPLLGQFYESLMTPGRLCIADLDSDGGQFHENKQGVFHPGFDRTEMHKLFIEAGFNDVQSRTVAEIEKPGTSGVKRKFTVFVMTGWKR
jgi:ubiquinone/menaquinone biosynthesis C-methylase UbiE